MRLQEFCPSLIVSVTMISTLNWESYGLTGRGNPVLVHFPRYQKIDAIEVMAATHEQCTVDGIPDELLQHLYRTFCTLVYEVMEEATVDLRDSLYVAQLMFPVYCQPLLLKHGDLVAADVEDEQAMDKLASKLYRNVQPLFRGILHKLHLREMSALEFKR